MSNQRKGSGHELYKSCVNSISPMQLEDRELRRELKRRSREITWGVQLAFKIDCAVVLKIKSSLQNDVKQKLNLINKRYSYAANSYGYH